jgi:hypothetical protein
MMDIDWPMKNHQANILQKTNCLPITNFEKPSTKEIILSSHEPFPEG